MSLPRIVGINGLKRSGKDTIGAYLVREHGYTRLSFAAPLYEAIYRLDPMVAWVAWEPQWERNTIRLQELIEKMGWEKAKDWPTPETSETRRLLEVFGTEVGRELFGQDFWVEQAVRQVNDIDRYVFTDVRFENEIAAVNSYKPDAYMLKVIRPGLIPNGHASDRDLPNEWFDSSVLNDGTIPELEEAVLDRLRVGR